MPWDGQNDYHRAFAYAADVVFVSGNRIGAAGTHMSFIDAGELAAQLVRIESSARRAQG